jgi:hypothetical protein
MLFGRAVAQLPSLAGRKLRGSQPGKFSRGVKCARMEG